MIKIIRYTVAVVLSISIFGDYAKAEMSKEAFFDKRTALIIKHSHHDKTFDALQKQKSFSPDYWRWRVDQYLYGQYPEYQPIYNAYIEGKSFNEIYDLPPENLGPKWQEPTNLPSLPDGYFTDNLPGNPHHGWQKLVSDKIYIVYQGHLTDPYVASYDLKTKQWDGPYKAGHSTLSKGDRKIDSHGRPILEVDSLGYIHIVFGGHGGEREDGLNPLSIDTPHAGGRMKHVVSAKPYDLSQFEEKQDITPFASYAKSYTMANGDIYFFTRAGTHKSPWVYYKMKNGTQTFEPAVTISLPTSQLNDPIMVDTFYINPMKVSDTEIVITSLWHACNFYETHDKTHYNRLNAYFMKLDTTNDTFYNIKNEKLTLPLTISSANKYTLAYNSEKDKVTSFGTKPLVLKDGSYSVAYEARGKGYREWRMAKFDEGKWSHNHPLPGTTNRKLLDKKGTYITDILALEVLEEGEQHLKAAVIYKNDSGNSVFAIANSSAVKGRKSHEWQVDKVALNVGKSRISMQPIKDDAENTVALVVNVRKGQAQRLYLWHDGAFRKN